jgi:hypothetical protein
MKKLIEKILIGNLTEANDLVVQCLKERIARGIKRRKSTVMDDSRHVEGSQSKTPKPYYR